METLRRIGTKVFPKYAFPHTFNACSNIPCRPNNDSYSSPVQKKPRDKTLRHSRSMPLHSYTDIDPDSRPRPVYRGRGPLKTSDIQIVLDIRGTPKTPYVHTAFEDNEKLPKPTRSPPSPVKRHNGQDSVAQAFRAAKAKPELSHKEVIDQFPEPPQALPTLPLKIPKKPLLSGLDLLPPNPAFDKAEYARLKAGSMARVHQRSASEAPPAPRYESPVSPEAVRRYYGLPVTDDLDDEERIRKPLPAVPRPMMAHANLSTQSLGGRQPLDVRARLRQGPVARHPVVVQKAAAVSQAMPVQPRPRMQSNTSVRSAMDHSATAPPRRYNGLPERPAPHHAANPTRVAVDQTTEFGQFQQENRTSPLHRRNNSTDPRPAHRRY